MKQIIFLFAFTCIVQVVFGQVTINEPLEIKNVMDAYKTKSNDRNYLDGWRIQIINTDDRRQMESARSLFGSRYPYLKMTWEHEQPYYKVQVGAYQTKLELEAFLRELKDDFPRAIPIRDRIRKSEFTN